MHLAARLSSFRRSSRPSRLLIALVVASLAPVGWAAAATPGSGAGGGGSTTSAEATTGSGGVGGVPFDPSGSGGGSTYGFSHSGAIVEIDNVTGGAGLVKSGVELWDGAGVTTVAPVIAPPPPK